MNTTFPLSGKTFCLHFTKSTSQRETLPGKRENISPYEQDTLFDLSKCFLGDRDNFCPYEQALSPDFNLRIPFKFFYNRFIQFIASYTPHEQKLSPTHS